MSLSIAHFAAASSLMGLSCVAVGLRLFVRISMVRNVGVDDYLIVLSLLCYVAAESFVFHVTHLTSGKYILEILDVLTPALSNIYFRELLYVNSVWSLKLSIGTFLLRLVQNRRQKYIIYATIIIVSLYNNSWKPLGKGQCISERINTYTSYAHAVLTGFTDLIFAVLPIFVVWNLQMNTAMKVSVAGLLGLGAIGGITSFIRMPYLRALEEATPVDFFVVTYRLAIWTCVEPGVGIFVGSVATLRPLFKKLLGGSGLFSSRSESGHNYHSRPKSPSTVK